MCITVALHLYCSYNTRVLHYMICSLYLYNMDNLDDVFRIVGLGCIDNEKKNPLARIMQNILLF